MPPDLTAAGEDRVALVRRGQWLSYATIGYNTLEGVASIIAGAFAGSISLVGFGIDSLIEVASGGAALWRLRADIDEGRRERVERTSLRIIGALFVLLAAYVAMEAVKTLWTREAPRESIVGIVVAATSIVVMPLLARAKRRVAAGLSSRALNADARQTDLCMYLSAILLGGLALNARVGWWWADPLAALIMTPIIAHEGVEALRAKHSCETCAT
jgi:divalent metal cation (Fe/Co/Zn/Cd) transporter